MTVTLQANGSSRHVVASRGEAAYRLAGVERGAQPLHGLRKSCERDWLEQFPVIQPLSPSGTTTGPALSSLRKRLALHKLSLPDHPPSAQPLF